MAAEAERNLLNHYRVTNLYPSEWPQRDDDSDNGDEQDELPRQKNARLARRHSRFSSLDSRTKFKSRLSGPKDSGGGSGNIVQKDEPDPLGISPSVVSELRRRGLSVEDNLKLRNRFMLSSTTFSPTLFLSQVHQTASTEDLLSGLDFLSKSIEKKSASLKVLVESNFERFVRAKATIDNVYTEMRTQGGPPDQPATPASARRPHSRHGSRGGAHFRTSSNPFSPQAVKSGEDHRKNALTKESEYGVQGIKTPLIELTVKAEEVWGPALGGRDKEDELKGILSFMEQNQSTLRLGASIQNSIRKCDYDNLVLDFQKARRLSEEAKAIADAASHNGAILEEADVRQIIITARMWHDVENQISTFRRDALRQLANADSSIDASEFVDRRDIHNELISVLLQLGTDENPIWLWLSSWHDRLADKISRTSERTRLDIEILRRTLANGSAPSDQLIKQHLQSAGSSAAAPRSGDSDSLAVLQFWDLVESSVRSILSFHGGLLGEVADYWDNALAYIEGKAQKSLPSAVWNSEDSRQYLQLSPEHSSELREGAVNLLTLVRDSIFTLFVDPPIEDLSELISPVPQTPSTPASALSEKARAFGFDLAELPSASPRRGEAWEKFAFWPPFANSLSGAQYLSRILIVVGTAASDATAISVVKEDPQLLEMLKTMIGGVRERSVQALCAAWNNDAAKCKVLEDWTRSAERKDLTNMPGRFASFEETLLGNLQKILYISEAMTRSDSSEVVVPPSAKLLQMVRSQFVTSLYKALSGAVENAEKSGKPGEHGQVVDGLSSMAISDDSATDASTGGVGSTDRNIRMLLVLSNLNHLRRDIIPQLISQFETSFSVKLTEESKTIRDVLGQIDARLFQSYVKPTVDKLTSIISQGVTPASWIPKTTRPTNAEIYVYDVLLALVLVHTEVSTSATALTNQILSYLLEQISTALLNAFKSRPSYTLPALMQATLDVELIAQTLSNYTTDRASELQSQIYLVLDERTDQDARTRLQGELPEMRATLKRLREGTKGQFGCFKRERRGRTEARPGSRQ